MSGDRNEPGAGPEVGTVVEEAAKLLGALSEWAKDAAHDVDGALDEHLATGAAECTYCPICRTVHAVRGLSPEVRSHLATAATSLLQAASGLMATATPQQQAGGVEHIDLDDLPDDLSDDYGDWPEDTDPEPPEEGDR